jgi:hypothetical protein
MGLGQFVDLVLQKQSRGLERPREGQMLLD